MLRLKTIPIVTVAWGVLTLFKAFVLKMPVIIESEMQSWAVACLVILFLVERDARRKKPD